MPKMKTRRAVAARFERTGSGKLKRRQRNVRHNLENKTHKQKKHLSKDMMVHPADMGNLLKQMPYV